MLHVSKLNNVPKPVKTVSILLVCYAIVFALGILLMAFEPDFDNKQMLQGLGKIAALLFIAWRLPSLEKNAWWFATIMITLFCIKGSMALGIFIFLGVKSDGSYLSEIIALSIPLSILVCSLFILIKKSCRELYFVKTKA